MLSLLHVEDQHVWPETKQQQALQENSTINKFTKSSIEE